MKRIIFRADGNAKDGLGHLYRLFALVEMLSDDFECVFLTKETSTINVIPPKYIIRLLPDTVSLIDEASWISENYSAENSILITDGYQFNSNYQQEIKKKGFKLVYVDDLSSEYMYADLVINHSPHIRENNFISEPYTRFALGTKYAILRPLFLEAAKKYRAIPQVIEKAFICFGGSDYHDLTLKAVKSLLNIEQFNEINVVLGGAYQHTEIFELEKVYSKIKIYQNVSESDLIRIMERCHFAIAPTSTVLFELCAVKMIVFSGYYVDNQQKAFEAFKENGIIYGIGDFKNVSIDDIKTEIFKIIDYNHDKLFQKQFDVFDGLQKDRILESVKKM